MDRGWYTRLAIVLGACATAAYLLFPSYFFYYEADAEQRDKHSTFCKALPSWASCSKFNLGLDLQGGLHLVMGVEVEKAVQHRLDRLASSLREQLKEEELSFTRINRARRSTEIQLDVGDSDVDDVLAFIRKEYPILELAGREDKNLRLRLMEDEAQFVRDSAVEQTIKTIRNRADKLGVTEPTIAKRGRNSVLIQLPGIKDPAYAIEIIGRTAQLEFKIVDEKATAAFDDVDLAQLPEGVTRDARNVDTPSGAAREVYFQLPADQKEAVLEILEPVVPSNRDVVFGPALNGAGQEIPDRLTTYVVDTKPGITGDYLTNASVQQNPEIPSDYYVTMDFDPKGAQIFADLTEQNVGRRMAVVLDDTVNSAPVIQEKIGGGTARITLGSGGDSQGKFQEAKALSLVLKAGALPAPVSIREQRRVGQTLGAESVRKGVTAISVGGLLVVLFMLLYYRFSGLIANLALILNVVFVLAILAMFEATLTLPGMAGIVLTIGMAVDANVIIFERIREELRVGKHRAAIDAGYGKAFSTILDANLTTLFAGVVLMEYGSGPVRGFAVTLIVGILCSMFTAIVVTRLVFDFSTGRKRLQSLSI